MPREVKMDYLAGDHQIIWGIFDEIRPATLDEVLKVGRTLAEARDSIVEKYDGAISNHICVGSQAKFYVYLGEERNGDLELALNDFLRVAGTPHFIYSGSDYELVVRALRQYNKTLEKRLRRSGLGKWVVPLC